MNIYKLLILSFLLIPFALFAQNGPKFEITGGETINTGSHIRNAEVNYDIVFKNSGDDTLKIMSVSATCGCSSALASSNSLLPGEEGIIKFKFNGIGMGPVTKSFVVSTNEAESNSHQINMVMNMVDPVTLTPASIITEGKVGEELNQTASMVNSLDKPISISELTSNSPVVKVTCDKTEIGIGETASFNISIMIYEDSPVNAAVIIKTSEGEFQIPILVDIKSSENK
jgi:hypothetical protein